MGAYIEQILKLTLQSLKSLRFKRMPGRGTCPFSKLLMSFGRVLPLCMEGHWKLTLQSLKPIRFKRIPDRSTCPFSKLLDEFWPVIKNLFPVPFQFLTILHKIHVQHIRVER